MSRSISTVFVALAISQGVFSINVINVEPHGTINLELTNQTSPTIKLFDGERASGFIGDMTMGNFSQLDVSVKQVYQIENPQSYVVHTEMSLKVDIPGQKINYLSATNIAGSTVAFCGHESTLGGVEVTLNARFPPHSKSTILFTAGVSHSSTVKASLDLLIPFTLITMLVTNFHM